MKIYVSSVAFKSFTIQELEKVALEHDLSIEFSANFTPSENLVDDFLNLKIDRAPHNYFPPPKDPFVLNLASQNDSVLDRSVQHCLQGIDLASACGSSFYSAHAGFCLDPSPASLGEKLLQPAQIDRTMHWDRFIEASDVIESHARKKGVKFLVENNVLMKSNLRSDKINPLLCVEPAEIIRFIAEMNSEYLGFLLDTAHLKVSSESLGFDLAEAVSQLLPYTSYIHHSDNNGRVDSNDPLTERYWFLEFMPQCRDLVHVLEVKNQNISQIKQQIDLLKMSF